jgi:hypothetical protein
MASIEVSSKSMQYLVIEVRHGNALTARPCNEMLGCAKVMGTSDLCITALEERRSEMLDELTCGATADRTDAIGRPKVL